MERETGKSIKILRTDNGREYLSTEFNEILNSEGIERQLTVEYRPQQNGFAERANRTIVEMSRCMLLSSNLPEWLWGKAVNTSVYLRNRSPTKLLSKTPYEAWCGKKPAVNHLRIFGCISIVLNKRKGNYKFAAKGFECAMVGYLPESKAYRLYNYVTRQIVKSRDVKFIENCGSANNNKCEFTIEQPCAVGNNFKSEPSVIKKETKITNAETIEDDVFDYAVGEEENESETLEVADGALGGSGEGFLVAKKDKQRVDSTSKHCMNLRDRKNALFANVNRECDTNPITIENALGRGNSKRWFDSMQAEYNALICNGTWDLVDLPSGSRPIRSKWVFSIKRDKNGKVERYKSRLVAKGCSQRYGIDYTETFSPVVRYSSIRMIIALAVEFNLIVHQIDVATAYLNGTLNEEVYMVQPDLFVDEQYPNKVCKIKKALYGLK